MIFRNKIGISGPVIRRRVGDENQPHLRLYKLIKSPVRSSYQPNPPSRPLDSRLKRCPVPIDPPFPVPRTPQPSIIMVHKVLFWGGFGIAVRLWQLGIEMRPILAKESLWVYPLFAGVGSSFGYWLQGVEDRQLKILAQRREAILEKRRRRDQGTLSKVEEAGTLAATS